MIDLKKPPTEEEVSLLLNHQDMMPGGKDILRRLAFQRDSCLAENKRLRDALEEILFFEKPVFNKTRMLCDLKSIAAKALNPNSEE